MTRRFWAIIGLLVVIGVLAGGALYLAFPVAMTTYGGMGLNFVKTLSTPGGHTEHRNESGLQGAAGCSVRRTTG